MSDFMDQFDALFVQLLAVEANLHAATEVLGRVPFGRSKDDRRELDRLDHFVHAAHTTVDAMIDEFRTALRAAMKDVSRARRRSAR